MKKLLLSTAILFGTLTIGGTTIHADAVDSKTTDGNVGFTTPADGLKLIEAANLDFGNHPISANDESYKSETDTKATVQDIRGTLTGWNLQVAQTGQFKNGENELTNAQITLDTPTLDASSTAVANVKTSIALKPTGEASLVMDAQKGEGNGTAVENFAKGSSTLSVPGATVKVQGQYKTTLTWTLNDTVENN